MYKISDTLKKKEDPKYKNSKYFYFINEYIVPSIVLYMRVVDLPREHY